MLSMLALAAGDPEAVQELRQAASAAGLGFVTCLSSAEALGHLQDHPSGPGISHRWAIVACKLGKSSADSAWTVMDRMKDLPSVFGIVHSRAAQSDPEIRLRLLETGANMVTSDWHAVRQVTETVASLRRPDPTATLCGTCPDCGLEGLSELQLHSHHPLYHSAERARQSHCPFCPSVRPQEGLARHIHNQHGPPEPVAPQFFSAFAWVVCRNSDGRFLMVNEAAARCRGSPRYWLPAGRVDAGEGFMEAGARETLEEGGVKVRITGVLRFMLEGTDMRYLPQCLRIVLLAEPDGEVDPSPYPKTVPDFESVGGIWVTAEQTQALHRSAYRSPDPPKYFPPVSQGAMLPHSVSCEEFQRLESLTRRLTCVSHPSEFPEAVREFWGVWEGIRSAFPPTAISHR